MTKKRSFSLFVLGLAISLALVLCAGVLPAVPASGSGSNTVGMVIDPTPKTVIAGDTFTVNITVTISAGEAVNSASAHINFNTTCLEVVSITPGAAFPELQDYNLYDNTAGTIDCTGGAVPGTSVTANATLATLNLRAKAVTVATPLTFVFSLPVRETNAWYTPPGEVVQSVLSPQAVVNGTVTITPAAASRLEVMGIADPIVAGTASNVRVTAKDAYNNTVTSYNGTINFTSSDSQAMLPGNYIFQPSDNGVKIFSGVILRTLGPQWVKATDTVSGITGNQTTTVTANPAAASRLEVMGIADPIVAGTASNVTVTAKDASNNTVTSYNGTINFTSSDSQATLPGNYTFQPSDNGVKTFSGVILRTLGGQWVKATDTVSGITGNQNTTVTANPAAASRLEVTGNATMTAGGTNELTITARDQYGYVATSYSGVKNLTFSGPAVASGGQKPTVEGIVIGNVTSVSFTAGVSVANVATLNATKAETTVVNVSDSSVNLDSTGGYGLSLTVTPASASRLEVTGNATMTAGGTNELTIRAKDVYGNLATGYSGTKNLTFSGPAVASGGQKPTVEGIAIGNATLVSFTAGVSAANATTLVAYKAETTTVNVTDGSLSSSGYGLAVSVNTASASSLKVTGIADPVNAGTASNVTVTASDAYGNIATGYRGTINFTSNDTQATLPGNYTFVAGDNGIHTFINGVTLNTAGEWWVKATDTGTATITGEQTGITVSAVSAAGGGTKWAAIIGGIIGGLIVIGLLVYLLWWRRRK